MTCKKYERHRPILEDGWQLARVSPESRVCQAKMQSDKKDKSQLLREPSGERPAGRAAGFAVLGGKPKEDVNGWFREWFPYQMPII